MEAIRFARANNSEFSKVLRSRVRNYFKENNISKHANAKMVIKTISMLAIFYVPYALMVSSTVTSIGGLFVLWAIMGVGLAGIGMSIMHDANHGGYSKNERVNRIVGLTLNMVGGFSWNWKQQHCVLHHSFTNIDGHDEDIQPGPVMRFSPNDKRRKAHKYQHIYAWFFYSLMTFIWITFKDFKQLVRYKKLGLVNEKKESYAGLWASMIAWKVFYYGYFFVIPYLVLDISWWMFIPLMLTMHAVAGLILAIIFQPAHVVPTTKFPTPKDGSIENVWFAHQLETTANFAPNNKLLSWYVGGLNFQVEHHLFPGICHVHYPAISKIVEATAKEFNVPYNSYPTFRKAVKEHTRMLKNLGRYDTLPTAA